MEQKRHSFGLTTFEWDIPFKIYEQTQTILDPEFLFKKIN